VGIKALLGLIKSLHSTPWPLLSPGLSQNSLALSGTNVTVHVYAMSVLQGGKRPSELRCALNPGWLWLAWHKWWWFWLVLGFKTWHREQWSHYLLVWLLLEYSWAIAPNMKQSWILITQRILRFLVELLNLDLIQLEKNHINVSPGASESLPLVQWEWMGSDCRLIISEDKSKLILIQWGSESQLVWTQRQYLLTSGTLSD